MMLGELADAGRTLKNVRKGTQHPPLDRVEGLQRVVTAAATAAKELIETADSRTSFEHAAYDIGHDRVLSQGVTDWELARLAKTGLDPDWVLERLHTHPEEIVAVAGLLSSARQLARDWYELDGRVREEVD